MKSDPDKNENCREPSAAWLLNARLRLNMTQAELARALRVSIRAVQSYEQGWRTLPAPVAVQLLTLLAVHSGHTDVLEPCWKKVDCPVETRKSCPSYRVAHGYFCWVVAGDVCGKRDGHSEESLPRCVACPVTADFTK